MAKKIIVLDARADGPGQQIEINLALWADVPTARQPFYADPNAVSAFRNATNAELTALRNGSVVERVVTIRVDPGGTLAAIRQAAEEAFATFQDEITNRNQWRRYGTFWDGTSWTNVTVQ